MDDTLLADGFEEAFVGYFQRCSKPLVACYDYGKCIEILVRRDGMSVDEAVEYLEYNAVGAWVGDGTPAYLHLCSLEEFNAQADYQ